MIASLPRFPTGPDTTTHNTDSQVDVASNVNVHATRIILDGQQ